MHGASVVWGKCVGQISGCIVHAYAWHSTRVRQQARESITSRDGRQQHATVSSFLNSSQTRSWPPALGQAPHCMVDTKDARGWIELLKGLKRRRSLDRCCRASADGTTAVVKLASSRDEASEPTKNGTIDQSLGSPACAIPGPAHDCGTLFNRMNAPRKTTGTTCGRNLRPEVDVPAAGRRLACLNTSSDNSRRSGPLSSPSPPHGRWKDLVGSCCCPAPAPWSRRPDPDHPTPSH